MPKNNLFANLLVIFVHFWPIFASSTSEDEDQQLAAEPKIGKKKVKKIFFKNFIFSVYVDGMHAWDNCDNPALKRSLSAITGTNIFPRGSPKFPRS